jgi:branched-chain amino acid transport system substrate-binding protein
MKNSIKILVGIIIIALIVIAFTIFSNITGNVIKEDKIKVGVIATLTGVGSYQGQEELRGLVIARDEINQEGGINGKKIELVVQDSATNSEKAVNAFKELTEIDSVNYVIGDSWAATTVALVPIANQKNSILISPATGLDELSKDDMFFRTIPSTDEIMKVLAKYAYYNMSSRRVGILYQNNAYGKEHTNDFKKYFESLGGTVVDVEAIDMTQTDVHSELTKIKAENPDTIFNLHATGAMQGVPLKQAKELGINVRWLGSYGTENTPLVKGYGNLTDGFTYPYFYETDSKDPSISSFVKTYKEKYNEVPTFTSANSYDALKILEKSIKNAGEDPVKIKPYILTIKDYKGASGTFSFDKNGDVKKYIFMKQIQNGTFVNLI